jgi:hypothetical protein
VYRPATPAFRGRGRIPVIGRRKRPLNVIGWKGQPGRLSDLAAAGREDFSVA